MTSDDGSAEVDAGEAVGNLPHQLTRLIDRKEALAELASLIWRTRLVTLTGPGGAGKTRLAVALAETVRADFVGGAWWVDLSTTMDSASVPQTVATELFPEDGATDPTPYGIARRFAGPSLLLLDNCEQVVDGCGELVADLLACAPSLRVIATSRQPLGVPGERRYRVAGLGIEASDEASSRHAGPHGAAFELSSSALTRPAARLTRRRPERAPRSSESAAGSGCRSRSSSPPPECRSWVSRRSRSAWSRMPAFCG